MNGITAVVLTKNEEVYIADCLDSLQWCDQVVVLDSLSSDRTVEIARQHGAQVAQRPFTNFADQRNAAIALAQSEWVLFVDADERVSSELAEEIQKAVSEPEIDGYWIPTKNNYFGQWLNYGGFWPDYHLRLARKDKFHYDPLQKVHEHPNPIEGAGHLTNPLIHLCYQNLHDLKEAKDHYATLLAEIHYEKGLKPTYHLLAAPILTFFYQYFRQQSFRDGRLGLLISLVWAYYAYEEYRRVWGFWESARQKKAREEE